MFPRRAILLTITCLFLFFTLSLSRNQHLTAQQDAVQQVKAPPANDDFANAQTITLPYNGITNNMNEATIEDNEAEHPCRIGGESAGSHSVWFKFTVGVSGAISADTTNSTFIDADEDEDSLMTIYDSSMQDVACNDDAGGDSYASIALTNITAGTYYIQVSAWQICDTANCHLQAGSVLSLSVNFSDVLVATNTPTATHTSTAIPTATLDPNITPSPTYTLDPNITPTQTFTPTHTATPLIPSAELLKNGSFEFDTGGDGNPDDWVSSGANGGTSSGKYKCNKDTNGDNIPDKIIAKDGNCAYQFKSGAGENSKLTQDIDLMIASPAGINAGDRLLLSGFVDARGTVKAKVKVRITYTDTSLDKGKLTAKVEAATNDYSPLRGILSLTLSDEVQLIRFRLQNKGTSGKVRFDQMSLQLTNTIAPLP